MRFAVLKNKIVVQILICFIFCCLLYASSFVFKEQLDLIFYKNFKFGLILFGIITYVSVINGYLFHTIQRNLMEQPRNIIPMMKLLNYQLFLFSFILFLISAVFHNRYIRLPYFLGKTYILLNVLIFTGFLVVFIYKKKGNYKPYFSTLFPPVLIGAVIFQLNNMEIFFFGVYFAAIWLLSKIKSAFFKNILGKYAGIEILSAVFLIATFIYIFISGQELIIFLSYLILAGVLIRILYEDRKNLNLL
ncbi:hypothetical protein QA584_25770 [Anaerocolumna sp. AGMB13025]|uniref:hypothetical protein n=1 Tax=Anaerocolumna sp. AGMB13025 TaxID=3039116 RepID=UPI00241CB8BB|nr:hypothetical protein [Anaerocolumna sp. AGMB13025]WFR56984.1 hypothetical protein QA584_25770 [Anaerocolumna sp. AGMB13025]